MFFFYDFFVFFQYIFDCYVDIGIVGEFDEIIIIINTIEYYY